MVMLLSVVIWVNEWGCELVRMTCLNDGEVMYGDGGGWVRSWGWEYLKEGEGKERAFIGDDGSEPSSSTILLYDHLLSQPTGATRVGGFEIIIIAIMIMRIINLGWSGEKWRISGGDPNPISTQSSHYVVVGDRLQREDAICSFGPGLIWHTLFSPSTRCPFAIQYGDILYMTMHVCRDGVQEIVGGEVMRCK